MNYEELIQEEERLKAIVKVNEEQVKQAFTFSYMGNQLSSSIKDGIKGFFSFGNKNTSEISTFESGLIENDNQTIDLMVELLYQTISVALISQPISKQNPLKTNIVSSLKIVAKSILDNFYKEHKEETVDGISQFFKEKFNKKDE